MIGFKDYLIEDVVSIGDNNGIGKLMYDAKTNLNNISKKDKSTKAVVDCILQQFGRFEQDPGSVYTDGYSLTNILQSVANPKISLDQLSNISDTLSSYDGGE